MVVERIAGSIKGQNLSAGERLPGEYELVEQLKVSRPCCARRRHGRRAGDRWTSSGDVAHSWGTRQVWSTA
ncbi:MAG: GntR family transcriptional regulator [Planctomycetaceae bacterium]|nr:GntR family transcriptional regulator [Planctomycetaceae bacterium]